MSSQPNRCHICGRRMREFKGVYLCLPCNDKYGEYYSFFKSASREFYGAQDKIAIECPGVTIYDDSNTRVIRGVKWNDERDHSKGFEIIGKQIFAPNHKKTRLIDSDKADNISRCQACQDFTVRMRIYNQQKDREDYEQNSPLMPKNEAHFTRPSIHDKR